MRILFWSALLAAVLLPATVTAAGKVKIKAVITTSENINPNSQGRASPVRLVLYELASADAFREGDFRTVYRDDGAALGGDLIASSAQMLQPGQEIEIEQEFDEGTKFLGVVAGFRTIEGAQWRALVELEEKGFFSISKSNKLTIAIDDRSVMVTMD